MRQPFDFVEAVNELARSLQPVAEYKGLPAIAGMAHPAIPMLGDRKRAPQVLLNPVDNAPKFTENGTVRIAAASFENTPRVGVADTCIGIKAEHLGMLFEAFRQVASPAILKHRWTRGTSRKPWSRFWSVPGVRHENPECRR